MRANCAARLRGNSSVYQRCSASFTSLAPVNAITRSRNAVAAPHPSSIAREARKVVTVCHRAGRGVALEDPKRLIRWKQHAARFFGKRVLLLAAIQGVAVQVVDPPYTSSTCAKCGSVEPRQRHREAFRCWRCGYTHNADFNAARVIAKRATRVSCESAALARPIGSYR